MSDTKTLTLTLRNIDTYEGIDPRTVEERYSNYLTKGWLSTTQAWSWDGGDAIVVMANDHWGQLTGLFVVRRGSRIHVIEAASGGIQGVLRSLGVAQNFTTASVFN